MAARKTCYASRGKDGQEIRYESPGCFLAQAYKYFDWCDSNPWHKTELIRSGTRAGETIEIPMSRPYTIEGLCVFCGISTKTFAGYEASTTFGPATEHLRMAIRQHQSEGECVGVYSTAAISRISGLRAGNTESEPQGLVINVVSPETKERLEELKKSLSG
ncbi:hypothetical protein D0T84_20750 [Dysgonomonas sp. 521]|uniref:terminase small subunit n=1 Tax=Dysgonomonas sp. 521 TaxID=2302932 RepID=UPI0013D31D17|nr:terminase small subunit [Dysgonomonas sp. 521]NDV97309.1 hypothetical protein [Dysgonomonas sp. 521]